MDELINLKLIQLLNICDNQQTKEGTVICGSNDKKSCPLWNICDGEFLEISLRLKELKLKEEKDNE